MPNESASDTFALVLRKNGDRRKCDGWNLARRGCDLHPAEQCMGHDAAVELGNNGNNRVIAIAQRIDKVCLVRSSESSFVDGPDFGAVLSTGRVLDPDYWRARIRREVASIRQEVGYHVSLILTLTINPAVDRTVSVDKLVFEDRAYILGRAEAAGGRGVNASQVIYAFGGKTLALITSGGAAGHKMEESLAEMGFPYKAVPVAAESRINLTISDKQGLTVKLNEVGTPLTEKEVAAIRKLTEASLDGARWLMICGSMQPGVPPHFYCELIELAHSRGVKTLLDTDGEALQHALEAKPSVITPNQQEAERLLGRALLTRTQIVEAVDRIHAMGPQSVILSLGARGAIAVSPDSMVEALPPRVEALCPIGAGDALAAAFVWSMDKGKPFAESLRWGVAAGTATAALPGIHFPKFQQVRAMYKQVEVRPLR